MIENSIKTQANNLKNFKKGKSHQNSLRTIKINQQTSLKREQR